MFSGKHNSKDGKVEACCRSVLTIIKYISNIENLEELFGVFTYFLRSPLKATCCPGVLFNKHTDRRSWPCFYYPCMGRGLGYVLWYFCNFTFYIIMCIYIYILFFRYTCIGTVNQDTLPCSRVVSNHVIVCLHGTLSNDKLAIICGQKTRRTSKLILLQLMVHRMKTNQRWCLNPKGRQNKWQPLPSIWHPLEGPGIGSNQFRRTIHLKSIMFYQTCHCRIAGVARTMRVIGNDSNPWESKGTANATTPGNKALLMDLKNNDG